MVRAKRWDEPIEPDDGTRILVTRYRPRGLPKRDETWSEWLPALAPSVALHAAAYGKNGPAIGWSLYRSAYLREMLQSRDTIAALARRVLGGETITLLCSASCTSERRCHRSILREMIEAEAERQRGRGDGPPGDA